jgi:hypothetical protein
VKILRTAGALLSPQKRSPAIVSILRSLAAAEIANALHLRDFWSAATFEFFNTIGYKRTLPSSHQPPGLQPATAGAARAGAALFIGHQDHRHRLGMRGSAPAAIAG